MTGTENEPSLACPDIKQALLALFDRAIKDAEKAAWASAYAKGYAEGAENMRTAILKAANAPAPMVAASGVTNTRSEMQLIAEPGTRKGDRAPKGSVRNALTSVLTNHSEGLVETELGSAVATFDPQVSAKSIGAELRRHRDRRYRSEGGRWFLITQEGDVETTEAVTSAVPSTQTIKEESDAPETAIAA